MAKQSAKSIQQLIYEQKLKIVELEDELMTQTYLETMPEHGPTYQYCYGTSNFTIPYPKQSVDSWIRAVIKHMGKRSFGHGGEKTYAMLISIPEFKTEDGLERWLSYTLSKIKKKAMSRKRKIKLIQ
jgi:hypothetical protein